ncbi:M91 family zinc metallopeptidase [Pseudomonas alabamensis]|uniref:M91 family zinc metallopeptidase n=1 Tax=Pseudomonas alabamensis TaxID=3064349 RepID=UPI003F64C883
MNPNPTYFISGRTSGYAQWKETFSAEQTLHRLLEYRDDKLDIYLEQVWNKDGQTPTRHHMVLESKTPGAIIDVTSYDCHLLAVINGRRFVLAPTPAQTLIINTVDGPTRINVADEVNTPVLIQTENGSSSIKTGGGITEVFTGKGDIDITVGQGLAFILSASDTCRIQGNVLIDNPHGSGVYARQRPGDARFEAPLAPSLATLAQHTFHIKGDARFVQTVENHLTFLRHTRCGQQLLTQLAKRSWIQVSETPHATRFDVSVSDPSEEDHHLQQDAQGQWTAGWPAEGGYLALNLTRSDSDNLPLLDFYRCLCEAYNAFTGTTIPGLATVDTYDYRAVEVAKAHLQAIGLETDVFYDFDQNPATAPTDTNPSPFTENALRVELGLPRRRYY